MIIRSVDARWLSVPIPPERQHVSDFGRIASFDMALVRIEVDSGLVGWGESKAAVGSAGSCAALVSCIEEELRPVLVGEDARRISRLWELMYNGTRGEYALARGRTFPALGRRGLNIAAMSGVDMALWDLLGKSLDTPVVELWGGACTADMPVYASGGWADVGGIGGELQSYVDRGFSSVKMRVGVMDGDVNTSVARVGAARSTLGPDVGLMVDAHGTFSAAEARRFAGGVEQFDVRWFEEPVNADDRRGAAAVRASTTIPIAAGESEFTRFDFRDLIEVRAVDVLQPDLAICGGPTEGRRIAALAETYQLELAPHCWGSALSFSTGLSLAFASPAATVVEYSLGANPLLHDLVEETIEVRSGRIVAPTRPGLGVTPRDAFVAEHSRK
jgi:L-alanine-DL-glutamate epimerase-like enolase superfamily enzyme